MRSSAQDAANGECLGRTKVEIFENGAHLAVHERFVVLLDNHAAVPKDAVGNGRRCVVEYEQIDGTSCGALETRHEISELQCSEPGGAFQADGNVNIAARVCRATRCRSKEQSEFHTWIVEQDLTHGIHGLKYSMWSGHTPSYRRCSEGSLPDSTTSCARAAANPSVRAFDSHALRRWFASDCSSASSSTYAVTSLYFSDGNSSLHGGTSAG